MKIVLNWIEVIRDYVTLIAIVKKITYSQTDIRLALKKILYKKNFFSL
jgi:hypothetical protein